MRNGHNIFCTARNCQVTAPDGTDLSWTRWERIESLFWRAPVRVKWLVRLAEAWWIRRRR
jgi:hypothetical protein